MYDQRTDSAQNFELILKKVQNIFTNNLDNFDINNRDTSNNIINLGHLIKNLNDLQDGRVPKINEIYAGIKILSGINQEVADELEDEIDKLIK